MSHTPPPPDAEGAASKKPRLDIHDYPASPIPTSTSPTPITIEYDLPPAPLPTPSKLPTTKPPTTKKASKRTARLQRQKERKLKEMPEPYSPEDVLWKDIISIIGQDKVDQAIRDEKELDSPFRYKQEVVLRVVGISCGGEGLAIPDPPTPNPWVIVVPFSLLGERVLASIYRNARLHSLADFIKVLDPNTELRDDSRVRCKYFGKCAGCQYQMLSYETQLDWKRNVIIKAYKNFSNLPHPSIPPILPTIPSPLQYAYRTKLTPHFAAPPKDAAKKLKLANANANANAKEGERPERPERPEWLQIGFNEVGTRKVMDIEECPIGTPVINDAYKELRVEIKKNILNYKKGVSLLLRDSLVPSSSNPSNPTDPTDPSNPTNPTTNPSSEDAGEEPHICITNQNATVRERVGPMLFEYTAGSFFQNNNSVLEPLTSYVRDAIFPSPTTSSLSPTSKPPTHLVDAYCGSGLFALTLSPSFLTISGIELSSQSISSAISNAQLNNIPQGKCTFRSGTASEIFASVQDYPRDETAVIIDPPRKGCDEVFLRQLVEFGAEVVVYVSCNVVTQARDVGWILGQDVVREGDGDGERKRRYVLESVRGFDLFPQTAHVEGVAVLRLRQ